MTKSPSLLSPGEQATPPGLSPMSGTADFSGESGPLGEFASTLLTLPLSVYLNFEVAIESTRR